MKNWWMASGLAMVMALSACDGNGGGSGGSGGEGGAAGGGEGGAAGGAGGAGGVGGTAGAGGGDIQCNADPATFPDFDKSCAAAADCVLKFHMVDCCGTRVAIGINQADGAAFDAAEAICEMQYPGCGCAPQATTAEDGDMAPDESVIQVDCMSGSCASFVP
jgi:hypothetical protein